MSEPKNNRGASRQDYHTPNEFILAVEKRFGNITFDLAANEFNCKADKWFNIEQNSLLQDWDLIDGNLWLNPPFSDIAPWANKCARNCNPRSTILFLTPASIGSNWFCENVYNHALVLALSPRLCFDGKNPFPKDCILSVFSSKITPGFECWRWKI